MTTPPAESYRWVRWPASMTPAPLGYGADYNPDQWPSEVWDDDVRLMRIAGVNIVSLAIFSWARIQPAADRWDFAWLDEAMDLLHANGIAVDLATGTASPPPWLATAHPEILPVTRTGETLFPGGRQHWRPTSPVFREHALALVEAMATRYADHPALAAWHVSNELGCHNAYDYSEDAAAAFRAWLQNRYVDLEALNHAWGTAFWSQRYGEWEQILPPRTAPTHSNPTQQLDFRRFSSDALKDYLRAESAVLQRITPDVPITTNYMVMPTFTAVDYADWAGEVDFVANDHYVIPHPQDRDELSFSANLTSGIAGGRPWFLMEHSTSAVNWQPVNLAKQDGEMKRDSLVHLAHGADAICFFQWRASIAGAEKFHSAMVPHAGEDSAVFRAVTDLGATLGALQPVAGSRRRPARVAILFDWNCWWASELDSHPSHLVRYRDEALDWYSALLDLGVRADVVPAARDLSGYTVVIAPVLYQTPRSLAQRLTAFVEAGGHLITTYFSGIVDENDHIWTGGYPGALRDVLGIRIEEFAPIPEGESVDLDTGATATVWTDRIDVTGEDVAVLARYADGVQTGRPAITRRRLIGDGGSATYVSTRLGAAGIRPVLSGVLQDAGVPADLPAEVQGNVEIAVRGTDEDDFIFLVNRTSAPVRVPRAEGEVLAGAERADGDAGLLLGPRAVAVLRRPRTDPS